MSSITMNPSATKNIHLTKAKNKEEFVALRERRDRELPMPKLIRHSLQVNIRGGSLPEPEDNGRRYLKIPLDAGWCRERQTHAQGRLDA